MPGFDPNILKPEEELGGFGLSEPDGDIFSLKEVYPADIPQFENPPEPLIDETPADLDMGEQQGLDVDAEGITQAPLIENPESGNVWDAFDDPPSDANQEEPTVEETSPESITEEELPQEETTAEVETTTELVTKQELVNEEAGEDVSAFEEAEEIPDELKFGEPEEPIVEEVAEEPIAEEVPDMTDEPEETLSLGDDLKQMLEEELNRSKARREEAEKDKTDKEVIEKSDPTQFQPVEKVTETEFVDITDIDADEKQATAFQGTTTQNTASGQTQQEKVIEPKPPKKNVKLLKNISIASAAALLMLLLGAGLFQYWYYPNYMVEQTQVAETAPVHHEEEQNHDTGTHDMAKSEDTSHEDSHAESTHETVANDENHSGVSEEPKHEETAAVEHNADAPVNKLEAQTDVTHKTEHKTEHKEPEKVIPKTESTHTKVARAKKEAAPAKKVVATHTEPKRITKKATKTNNNTETVKPEETNELYAVQIYASPSKDDAEAWLSNLKDKDVDNPRISTQKVRDVIWYRVRFGNFKSKDDASEAAMRYGFAQTWIDRIK